MRQDAVSLDRFYAGALGASASRVIAGKIEDLWGGADGLSVLGLGFAAPVLGGFADATRCVSAVPGGVGAATWDPAGRGIGTVVTADRRLPFPDGLFDRAVILHGLEETETPRGFLRELWRVLAPEGRIVVAAANRRGLWARAESTPFGHGRPWTRNQLTTLMSESLFQVTASTHALHMPPIPWTMISTASEAWERAGELLYPAFGGVVLVEAVKRLYAEPGGSASAPVLDAIKARKGAAEMPRKQAAPCPKRDESDD